MKINRIDYKGKYHYWLDEELTEPLDMVIEELNVSSLTDDDIYSHVDSCVYYGIPAYTGNNEELNKRVKKAYNEINDMEANENVCLSCEG